MRLTNKCRREFEKWYIDNYEDGITNTGYIQYSILNFNNMPNKIKLDILTKYFKSVNIIITSKDQVEQSNNTRNQQLSNE